MSSTVLFATSMDPFTLGHHEAVMRFMRHHSRVVVGLGYNPAKTGMFSEADRLHLAKISLPPDIEVVSYSGPTITFAQQIGADVLGRGLRTGSDLDYEAELMMQNEVIAEEWGVNIETFYVLTSRNMRVSSSRVRELIGLRVGKAALEQYLCPPAAEWIVSEYYSRQSD